MALLKYILKKMLMLLPVLVGISIIAFALGIMSPGDPVDQVLNPNGNESYTQAEYDAMAAKMGLDQPAVVQYFNWVDGLAHGDLGRSFFTNKSVMDQLAKRIPISLKLAGFSMILTIVFGVGSGVLMAVKKDRLLDHVLGTFSTVVLSLPGFWIAIVLIFIFAEQWKILPSSGISDGSGFILPAITLERKTVCGQEEHSHTEECYSSDGQLACGKTEHTHTESCYADDKTSEDQSGEDSQQTLGQNQTEGQEQNESQSQNQVQTSDDGNVAQNGENGDTAGGCFKSGKN